MRIRLTLRQAGARLVIILALLAFYLMYSLNIIGADGLVTPLRAIIAGVPLIAASLLAVRTLIGLIFQGFHHASQLVKQRISRTEKLINTPILEAETPTD